MPGLNPSPCHNWPDRSKLLRSRELDLDEQLGSHIATIDEIGGSCRCRGLHLLLLVVHPSPYSCIRRTARNGLHLGGEKHTSTSLHFHSPQPAASGSRTRHQLSLRRASPSSPLERDFTSGALSYVRLPGVQTGAPPNSGQGSTSFLERPFCSLRILNLASTFQLMLNLSLL